MRSDEINEIAQALAKAQGQMTPAKKSGRNPHFKSTYSTMQDLIDAAKGPLAANGLSITQLTSEVEDGKLVETFLMHQSGQWLHSEWKLSPNREGPQALGSELTYARRYCYESILGLAGILDDDGEVAEQKPQAKKPAAKKPAPKPTNGNGKVPTTGKDLFDLINKRVQVPYNDVNHLRNAIAQELGVEKNKYSFPGPKDTEAWRIAYKAAKDHAERKTQPEQDALIETNAAQPYAPDMED